MRMIPHLRASCVWPVNDMETSGSLALFQVMMTSRSGTIGDGWGKKYVSRLAVFLVYLTIVHLQ
jgi:hypothetical protein